MDETSVKTNLTRQRGWSPRGDRLVMDTPFGSWGTQTFVADLSTDALIPTWVIIHKINQIIAGQSSIVVELPILL